MEEDDCREYLRDRSAGVVTARPLRQMAPPTLGTALPVAVVASNEWPRARGAAILPGDIQNTPMSVRCKAVQHTVASGAQSEKTHLGRQPPPPIAGIGCCCFEFSLRTSCPDGRVLKFYNPGGYRQCGRKTLVSNLSRIAHAARSVFPIRIVGSVPRKIRPERLDCRPHEQCSPRRKRKRPGDPREPATTPLES